MAAHFSDQKQQQFRLATMAVLFVICLLAGHTLVNEVLAFWGLKLPVLDSMTSILSFTLAKAGLGLAVGGLLACLADELKKHFCSTRGFSLRAFHVNVFWTPTRAPRIFSGGLFRPPRLTP